MSKLIGSRRIRALALLCAAVSVAAVAGLSRANVSAAGVWRAVAIVSGVATAMCVPFCSRRLYRVWMRFAELLNAVVMTSIFGLCYLLIVPFFALLLRRSDPLRARSVPGRQTFWVARHRPDPRSFERMG